MKLPKLLKKVALITAPVMFGYLFAGMAFGLMLQNAGYSFVWALLSSIIVYAGSMQYVLVGLLSAGTGLVSTAVIALAVQIRHAFYGLSLIEQFKNAKKYKPYLVFALTDETYSLLCSTKVPEGVCAPRFYFWISLLNQCYWIAGSVLGATVGELIAFDTTGVDFAMTALFLVILTEQLLSAKSLLPAFTGFACAAVSILLFGAQDFLPPALLLTAAALMSMRGLLEKRTVQTCVKEAS